MKYLLIINKMKKTLKNTIYLFIVLITLNACQSVKDGLTGKKKQNSDEFLVEKKNPLVLPPEFQQLPEPESSVKNSDSDFGDDSGANLEEILTKNTSKTTTTSTSEVTNGSLEKNILKKIKKN